MNPDQPDFPSLENFQEPEVKPQRRISTVWLIPIIATLIGGWLAYRTISEMGPTITITFKDGGSLEAGKTKIKYKSVEIGEVEDVELSKDLTHVTVTAKMDKEAEPHLTEETKFWVVRPRVGVGGISGLETLVSGAYIEVDPRPGPPTRAFTGLEKPPGVTAQEAGTQYRLQAESLGTIGHGTPVFFRDIPVGRVVGYELAKDVRNVFIDIFIEAPHDREIQPNSRFWKVSAVEMSMGAEGFDLKVGSLAAIIGGGIAFLTPVTATGTGEPSPPLSVFRLYESYASQAEAKFTHKVP
ncbi:MAG: MlaD family protein, partial [Kiloniellales bacterium]|nr:MlaD family protein [Kiloniellales bacterium]